MAGSFAPSLLTLGHWGRSIHSCLSGRGKERAWCYELNCERKKIKKEESHFSLYGIASHLKKEKSQQTSLSQTPLVHITIITSISISPAL